METTDKIKSLFEKYISGAISEGEELELSEIIACYPGEELSDILAHFTIAIQSDYAVSEGYWDNIIANVLQQAAFRTDQSASKREEVSVKQEAVIAPARRIHLLYKWSRVAVVVILAIATGAYFWFHNSRQQTIASDNKHLQEDIAPGREGAILTLADGSQVVLDSLGDGFVATQNGSQVMLKSGQIAYAAIGNATEEIVHNTMSTPKGRQFQVTLPDGTQVWLNAASSIRYPTVFTGKERTVFVTGEAYFEVAQNAQQPFRININNMAEVDVLGTSFNINAYENEAALQTTLLEGSVKVNGRIIKIGQQAQVTPASDYVENSTTSKSSITVVNADTDVVMAWKHSLFNFTGLNFAEIMRQLERWYDINVVYENSKIPTMRLNGEMNRDIPLNSLLKNLGKMGVRFRLEEGRRLVILQQ